MNESQPGAQVVVIGANIARTKIAKGLVSETDRRFTSCGWPTPTEGWEDRLQAAIQTVKESPVTADCDMPLSGVGIAVPVVLVREGRTAKWEPKVPALDDASSCSIVEQRFGLLARLGHDQHSATNDCRISDWRRSWLVRRRRHNCWHWSAVKLSHSVRIFEIDGDWRVSSNGFQSIRAMFTRPRNSGRKGWSSPQRYWTGLA